MRPSCRRGVKSLSRESVLHPVRRLLPVDETPSTIRRARNALMTVPIVANWRSKMPKCARMKLLQGALLARVRALEASRREREKGQLDAESEHPLIYSRSSLAPRCGCTGVPDASGGGRLPAQGEEHGPALRAAGKAASDAGG